MRVCNTKIFTLLFLFLQNYRVKSNRSLKNISFWPRTIAGSLVIYTYVRIVSTFKNGYPYLVTWSIVKCRWLVRNTFTFLFGDTDGSRIFVRQSFNCLITCFVNTDKVSGQTLGNAEKSWEPGNLGLSKNLKKIIFRHLHRQICTVVIKLDCGSWTYTSRLVKPANGRNSALQWV